MAEAPGPGPARPARWRRAGLLTVVGVLLVAGAAAGITAALSARRGPAGHGSGIRVATAHVVRTDLANTVQVSGSLSYAGSFAVVDEFQGTAYTTRRSSSVPSPRERWAWPECR
jgi:hypothetical protein